MMCTFPISAANKLSIILNSALLCELKSLIARDNVRFLGTSLQIRYSFDSLGDISFALIEHERKTEKNIKILSFFT